RMTVGKVGSVLLPKGCQSGRGPFGYRTTITHASDHSVTEWDPVRRTTRWPHVMGRCAGPAEPTAFQPQRFGGDRRVVYQRRRRYSDAATTSLLLLLRGGSAVDGCR